MKPRGSIVLASLLMTCAFVAPAAAGLAPYVRLDYGGSKFRMADLNNSIGDREAAFRSDLGLPIEFDRTGAAYGPAGSVGLWITHGFRVGATYSYLRGVRGNNFHVATPPSRYTFDDVLDLRMSEIGAEAAVRFEKLWGLTLGASLAQGRGELREVTTETLTVGAESVFLRTDLDAHRSKPTYGGFVGIDQTNAQGVVGYVRAGFQYRDMGHMAGDWSVSDGVNTARGTAQTTYLDYSGFYVKVGVGYDLSVR
jgi:hypothetical protein